MAPRFPILKREAIDCARKSGAKINYFYQNTARDIRCVTWRDKESLERHGNRWHA
jgi:hypothetical protein